MDAPKPVRWLKVLDNKELPDAGLRAAKCEERPVCIARHRGRVTVFEDICPHQGSPLSTGWLWEGLVVCPWHGWAFNPMTGEPSNGLGAPLQMLESEVREDGVYVAVPDDDA